jgi:hypothetical protein
VHPLTFLFNDDPTRAAPWDWRQWVGFAIYGLVLLAVIVIAWKLSGTSANEGERRD